MTASETGDRQRIATLLHNFADRLPQTVDRMDRAATTGDSRALARLAHTLKGSSATLGANHFASLCADVEAVAQRRDLVTSTGLLSDLRDRADEVGDAMQEISAELERVG
jgi:HPt (histidine-containing phosphotransfer) domain-containing protein